MTNDEPLIETYRPETLEEIQGNNSALDDIANWADTWSQGDPPILLVGVPGTGKTSTAECLANRLNLQTVEINASSARTTDDLQSLRVQIQSTGEDGHRLILVDEVDSWHHGPNKQVLYDALDDPGNPVVLTANDDYEVPNGIQKRAEEHEFKLRKSSIRAKLKEINETEGFDFSDAEIETLADRNDLRSAINDMQLAADDDLPPDASEREFETSEWDMLDDVMTGTPDTGTIAPPDALLWLDECLSAEYRGLELAMAYEALTLADLELRRARETSYRHWRYVRAILEEVAHIRTTEPYYGDEVSFNNKNFPEWLRHSKPNPDGDTGEASLYRALKKPSESGFTFAGSFALFRQAHLPILQDLSTEEKHEIVLSHGLDEPAMDALGVQPTAYRDWVEEEAPEAGEWEPPTTDASEW